MLERWRSHRSSIKICYNSSMSIIIFILVLALLIFIHELGHFIAAKLTGMKVEEFSVGFKPAIFQKKKGETNYVLGIIPIGGYVKILGENPNENEGKKLSKKDKKRTFSSKPWWAQIIVLSMGVIFNIILAWIFISTPFIFGISTQAGDFPNEYSQKEGVKILAIQKDFPAEKAGLSVGDVIVKISSEKNMAFDKTAEEFREFLKENPKNLKITYKQKEDLDKKIDTNLIHRTEIESLKEKDGKYLAGIFMADVVHVQMPIHKALYYGAIETWDKLKEITFGLIGFFGEIFTGKAELDSVSGPVGIVKYVGDAASVGWTSLILFTAFLSLNLAVINFLPFPALDGGRVIFVLIEAITRKKIPTSIFNWANGLGFLFLIGLMIVITFNDVWNLF